VLEKVDGRNLAPRGCGAEPHVGEWRQYGYRSNGPIRSGLDVIRGCRASHHLRRAHTRPFSGSRVGVPHKEAVTNVAGRYLMSLPVPSSNTGAIDQPFELRVHKDGYRTVSRSFQFAYSVWDYGGVEVNVELSRD
jgi:hypothetical protein